MTAAYLWLNAILYAALAIWCTVLPAETSRAIGLIELSASGMSEYMVIYGGMQFGFAILFGWAARQANHRFGLVFALALYAPIVLFRVISVTRLWPVSSATLITGALEIFLPAVAIALSMAAPKVDRVQTAGG